MTEPKKGMYNLPQYTTTYSSLSQVTQPNNQSQFSYLYTLQHTAHFHKLPNPTIKANSVTSIHYNIQLTFTSYPTQQSKPIQLPLFTTTYSSLSQVTQPNNQSQFSYLYSLQHTAHFHKLPNPTIKANSVTSIHYNIQLTFTSYPTQQSKPIQLPLYTTTYSSLSQVTQPNNQSQFSYLYSLQHTAHFHKLPNPTIKANSVTSIHYNLQLTFTSYPTQQSKPIQLPLFTTIYSSLSQVTQPNNQSQFSYLYSLQHTAHFHKLPNPTIKANSVTSIHYNIQLTFTSYPT